MEKVLKYLIRISVENQLYEAAASFRSKLSNISGERLIGPRTSRTYVLSSLENIEEYQSALDFLDKVLISKKENEIIKNILKRNIREEKINNILNENRN